MASLNRVILIGNLTRDPELRFTPAGKPVASFGLAVNRNYTNKEGEKVQAVDYFNIVTWNRQAELCAEYIRKGSSIALEGRLQTRSWETEDGQKRRVVEVVADRVQFLGKPGAKEADAETAAESSDEALADFDLSEDIPF